MKVLLVESTPGNGRYVEQHFAELGHQTEVCFDESHSHVCRGVESLESCPLHDGADVAVLVRDAVDQPHGLTEMSSVCAQRQRIPVLTTYAGTSAADVVVQAEALAESIPGDYVAAVRSGLRRLRAESGIDPEGIGITVQRSTRRITVELLIPAETSDTAAGHAVNAAARAVRHHDASTPVIDVSVRRC